MTVEGSFTWKARILGGGPQEATVYSRNHTFKVGAPASFREADALPSAIEYLLGALGGDLVNGFQAQAARQDIAIDALELALSAQMNNPLVFLGVIGEAGHAGLETISGTLYVSADAAEATLQQVWQTALDRSPLRHTLQRCVALALDMQVVY